MEKKIDKNIIILAVISIILFFWNNGAISLWSPDEPRFGAIVKHMVEKNDYIIPIFNGKPLYWKPILVYWLMALPAKIIGHPNEFTMRLPSSLSATIIVLFFYLFVKKWKDEKTAFLSSFILITNYTFLEQAKEAIIDMTLTLFMFLAVISFFEDYEKNKRKSKFLKFAVFSAFAVLCKGPVGIIVPSLIAIVYISIKRDFRTILNFFRPLNILLFLAIALPWYIAATIVGGYEFFHEFIIRQNIIRFFKAFDHIQPFYYYFEKVLTHFFPWSFILIPASIFTYKEIKSKRADDFIKFMAIWGLSVFIFFSISKSKRSQYILLFYPSASFITAYFITTITKLKSPSKLPVSFLWIKMPFTFICIILGIFFIAFPSFVYYFGYFPKSYFTESLIWCFILLMAIFYILYSLTEDDDIKKAKKFFKGLSAFAFLSFAFMVISLYPALDTVRSAIPYAKKIDRITKGKKLISFYFERPEFVYYMSRDSFPVLEENETDKLIKALSSKEKIYCIISKKYYEDRIIYLKKVRHKIVLKNLKGWKWDLLLISN